ILLAMPARDSPAVSIEAISKKTGMTVDDIISTLQTDGMLQRQPGLSNYALVVDVPRAEAYLQRARDKSLRRIDPAKLRWAPFLTKAAADAPPPPPHLQQLRSSAAPMSDGEQSDDEQSDGDAPT
ncbi:Histone acetyltransferase, partial [Coemansia nantahalensis]